jgi:hypothetical protein
MRTVSVVPTSHGSIDPVCSWIPFVPVDALPSGRRSRAGSSLPVVRIAPAQSGNSVGGEIRVPSGETSSGRIGGVIQRLARRRLDFIELFVQLRHARCEVCGSKTVEAFRKSLQAAIREGREASSRVSSAG